MTRLLERRRRTRKHPDAEQALQALQAGRCLYAATGSACSGPPRPVPLRNDADDANAVLACGAHVGRLRRMPDHDLARLERHLLNAFVRPAQPRPEPDEPTLVAV